ncbi:MAG: bifunctional precorrin-2 dehydrogenase/sirohydrochlorin ferrochelatase [Lachnospiraceae bacterium]|nr:bifunctional precorrin-2 dehydrogenase/sirohydrochlorin ferrochelatase [Lachnospiraceae bacterium]
MRFPMFIELEGKKAVVAGAGRIGTRRIRLLADFGAWVTVIAPEISDEVRRLWEAGQVSCELREIEQRDVEGAFLAVAATDQREINRRMAFWCRSVGIPVNVADRKEECDFYFPGIARAGCLTAGVCAGGNAHRLAKEAAADIRGLFAENAEKYGLAAKEGDGRYEAEILDLPSRENHGRNGVHGE